MLLSIPLLALFQSATVDSAVYDGRAHRLAVRPPRIEAEIVIDGNLDEPVWRRAAVLTGFSLYQPVDQRPAPDSTEVLVWYSSSAIYFGVRAFEPHAAVRATLADRDNISNDDNVEIQLDTYHDRRRTFVFIVNPLGVQGDGTRNEGGSFIPGSPTNGGGTDLSSDFIWDSKGHLTPWGYQVEIRIPFKSLRYPALARESWGIQIDRHVQHSGYEETWTPALKGSASFIAQEGVLTDMAGMHHGEVVELNPEATTSVNGAPVPTSSPTSAGTPLPWRYTTSPALGGNVKWGLTSNFVLNGTVKPDFSQVEADALQIAGDARFALFYAEKRPFFVDGVEQFNVPNNLIYTRRIVHPNEAAKVTGKIGSTDVAVLSAADDPQASLTGRNTPLINILRLRRDFAGQSTAGLLYSDRTEGSYVNRMGGGDLRWVFGGLYFAQLQAVASLTRLNDTTRTAPLWEAVVDRTGRRFGFHYNVLGIGPSFVASNGFVPRRGFVQPSVANRFTVFGAPGSVFERYNVFAVTAGTWRYDDFFSGRSLLEDRAFVNNQFTFRGGWTIGVTPTIASYAFDPALYSGYYVGRTPDSTAVPIQLSGRTPTFVVSSQVTTPQFRHFAASVGATVGHDVDFFETSRVRRTDFSGTVDWRPTEKLRVDGSYLSSAFGRLSDNTVITTTKIPRIKLEYQLARPIFVRFVGQYQAFTRRPLVDPRTGLPIILRLGDSLALAPGSTANGLRVDWLFSYRPTPGTVFFAGYGSSLTEPDALAFRALRRAGDGFFVKLSYLFRL